MRLHDIMRARGVYVPNGVKWVDFYRKDYDVKVGAPGGT